MKTHFLQAFRDYRPLIIVGFIYAVTVFAEAHFFGIPPESAAKIIGYFLAAVLTSLCFLSIAYLVVFMRGVLTRDNPYKTSIGRYRFATMYQELASRNYLEGDIAAYALVGLLASVLNCVFFMQKSLIPVINPYSWDPFFAELDRILHFGFYPHDLIGPMVDDLGLLRVLDFLYVLWLPVTVYVITYSLVCDRGRHSRLQFQMSHMLAWIILGGVFAISFSSVGPIFFGDFYPNLKDPYADMYLNLEEASEGAFLFTMTIRSNLLEWTTGEEIFRINKISAMPSLHVGIAWMMVLYARAFSRRTQVLAVIFFACILLGSVLLGFHYAIDGYFSIIVVSLIWWAVGRYLNRAIGTEKTMMAPVLPKPEDVVAACNRKWPQGATDVEVPASTAPNVKNIPPR